MSPTVSPNRVIASVSKFKNIYRTGEQKTEIRAKSDELCLTEIKQISTDYLQRVSCKSSQCMLFPQCILSLP